MEMKKGLHWASVFLSHSSKDKDLVKAIATELTQRGIIPWLDINELLPGQSLTKHLEKAVNNQAGFVVILSEASVTSSWVEDELATAFDIEKQSEKELIIPLYLGDAIKLVYSHNMLKSRWLHPDGDRVKKLGIFVEPENNNFDPGKIAEQVALRVYDILNFKVQREVVICLDQRGAGSRTGIPDDVPDNINSLNCPGLIFRPDLGDRSQNDVVTGSKWETITTNMRWSLEKSLGNATWPVPKKIRIIGHSQLALPFSIGHYFNRNTTADLFCYHHSGTIFTNKNQSRFAPLEGGNAQCSLKHEDVDPIPDDFKGQKLALFLMRKYLLSAAIAHLKSCHDAIPGVWVDNCEFKNSDEVMVYVKDVVALLQQHRQKHGITDIYLFTSLPFNVLSILAANLLHVVHKIEFMEFRQDVKENPTGKEGLYTQLSIKK
jgi:hypothetical protein